MQTSSIRKISFLGLVLMGASAVTAAILPKPNKINFAMGSLTANNTSRVTCSSTNIINVPIEECNASSGFLGFTVSTDDFFYDSASVSSVSADCGAGRNNTSDQA